MKWQVVVRPQAENDIVEIADWYDSQSTGLGAEFIEQTLEVFDSLERNPLVKLPPTSYEKHPLELSKKVPLSSDL